MRRSLQVKYDKEVRVLYVIASNISTMYIYLRSRKDKLLMNLLYVYDILILNAIL